MSIYDENKFSFPTVKVSFKQFKYPLIAIVALIVIVAALFSLNEFLKPKPLTLSISPNPLDLTAHGEASSLLNARVFNTTNETASSIVVKVEELGTSNLIIFPDRRRIDAMASGMNQQLDPFVIRPNPNKEINSGSYKLRVSLFISEKKVAEEELTLVIKAV